MTKPYRGVAPPTLLDHVRNTIPYLFQPAQSEADGIPGASASPFLARLLEQAALNADPGAPELSHDSYYRLCVSAHFATVATPVPTDVDNQIRLKLWDPGLDSPTVTAMVETVIEAASWDTCVVSRRWVRGPRSGAILSGHGGEWFSIAVGAYCALRKRSPAVAGELAQRIVAEMKREQEIFSELKAAGDGLGMMKAATLLAHNLGDLDRVMDMWDLPDSDPLRGTAYQSGHSDAPAARAGSPGPGPKVRAILAEAGDLNKLGMAVENHRHFALRAPRCLRRSPEFLIPIGPFFDDWGALLVTRLPASELAEVAQALIEGFTRLNSGRGPGPVGYARALAGIEATIGGGTATLEKILPARFGRELREGKLRAAIDEPRARFEDRYRALALKPRASRV